MFFIQTLIICLLYIVSIAWALYASVPKAKKEKAGFKETLRYLARIHMLAFGITVLYSIVLWSFSNFQLMVVFWYSNFPFRILAAFVMNLIVSHVIVVFFSADRPLQQVLKKED